MRLESKVALITGGASGIGRAMGTMFAKEGAKVCIADLDAKKAEQTVEEIRKSGGSAVFVTGDVSKAVDAEKMVKTTVSKFGKVDILVNNAGFWFVDRPDRVVDLSEEDWNQLLGVNLKSVFLCSKYAVPEMIKQHKGSIINLTSECGLVGYPGAAGYCSAKGGVVLLTKQMALDYASQGIRVNCIAPTWILTPMVEKELVASGNREGTIKRYTKVIPLGRMGRPEEVAYAALFLASDESSFTTGSVVKVDGGVTAGAAHTFIPPE